MQDKTLTVPRWSVFTLNSMCTNDQSQNTLPEPCTEMDETKKEQVRNNTQRSTTLKAVTKWFDIVTKRELSGVQEMSRLF